MTEPKGIPRKASIRALFLPNLQHAYLRDAERFPRPRALAFDPVDAWWMAELSLLSYVDDAQFVREVLQQGGFGEVAFFANGSTHCVCADDVVVFRGTDEVDDVLRDLDAGLVPEGAGRVHRGFQQALDQVWEVVEAHLGGRPATFTGHSLGGALASIAAMRYRETQAAYTLGSPRVGNGAFRAGMRPPVHRIVNNNDVVTRLPPPLGYRHVGQLQYIDHAGNLHAAPERWERIKEQLLGHGTRALDTVQRWLAGDFEAIPYDSLVDHAPIHYAIHLWNDVVAQATGAKESGRKEAQGPSTGRPRNE